MTDDIVTRLRAYNIGNIGHEASAHMEETLYEAADEIELLRSALLGLACDFVVEAYLDKSAEAVVEDYYQRAVRGE